MYKEDILVTVFFMGDAVTSNYSVYVLSL